MNTAKKELGPVDRSPNDPPLPRRGEEVDLSIVIGTRNRKAVLTKCLQALIGNIDVSHEIIVIDAGSTDGSLEYLKEIREIQLVCDGKPIGQARSFNRVFATLNSRFVCWISDDNVVQPGALDTAVHILKQHDKIGMVALKVKDVAGHQTGAPYNAGIYDTGILNCNQGAIRAELFRKVGYFDESLKNYGIDPDLTTKVLLTGARVVHTKEVAIHHFRDHDAEDSAIPKEERTRNKELYKQQYYDKYAFLVAMNFFDKCGMRCRKVVWKCIKVLNKALSRRRWELERITGQNIKDWENLTRVKNISIFDLFYNRNNPFHLEQKLPKKKITSNTNPFRNIST
ncbi:MAG: glycosyltransferase [Desulfobacterales bacterium]|nr:glycosyltransferase [Desulfobacterales bacterium]